MNQSSEPGANLKAHYTLYSILEAAALWCGVAENQLAKVVQESTPLPNLAHRKCIWRHPDVPDLEYRCRAIVEGVLNDSLQQSLPENSMIGHYAYIPYEDKVFLGRDLKIWMEKEFPNDKPAFLFGDLESDIPNADTFQALQAECDALKKKLAEQVTPSERSERTYQHIIAALLKCVTGKIPGVDRHPSFASEAKLIETILEHYPRYEGLSQSTLQRKFAEAKRAFKS